MDTSISGITEGSSRASPLEATNSQPPRHDTDHEMVSASSSRASEDFFLGDGWHLRDAV